MEVRVPMLVSLAHGDKLVASPIWYQPFVDKATDSLFFTQLASSCQVNVLCTCLYTQCQCM